MNGDNMNTGSFGNSPGAGAPGQPPQPPQQPQQNQQNQQFAPPPPKEVDVRTMGSDTKSMERGDISPMPDKMAPPQFGAEPSFAPETQIGGDFGGKETVADPAKSQKVWIWTAIIAAVVVLGVGGYFALPFITGTPDPIVEEVPGTPIVPVIQHQSYLVPAPLSQSTIQLSAITQLAARNSLELVAGNSQSAGTLQEVSVQNSTGGQIPFAQYMSVFAPELTVTNMEQWFDEDFTTFIHYDANGAWPGYVARLKSGVNIDEVRASVMALEGTMIANFYLGNPGTFGAFKDGQINTMPTRYSVGSIPGASFNFAILGNYFVITTSYPGLQAVTPLLGFSQ
ncbi:MAG: hypothetical protein AAB407_01595 [Patescibacteria group bacterium]